MLLASLLLAAGVVVATSPLAGQVTPADGAPVSVFLAAGWVAVLPGVLAVGLALVNPSLGLAATAGSGLIGLSRLIADLAVVTETDRVSRPELFVETTERARPLVGGAGGWVLLAADGLMVVVGVLAARRLAGLLFSGDDPGGDHLFGAPVGRQPFTDVDDGPALEQSAVARAMGDTPAVRRRLNLPLVGTGFAGAVLLLVGSLDIPYTGGYLALRVLPFGTSVSGLAAAVVLAVTVSAVVLVAGGVTAPVARALLGGTALAAAVPSLTAVVAVLVGAPTGLSPVVWWALGGAALVAGSGLLAGPRRSRASAGGGSASPQTFTMVAAVAGLLAAAALAGASRTALLHLDGVPPDDVTGVLLLPASLPLLLAALPLAAAAGLTIVPATAAAGRAALLVVWAGAGYAVGRAFWAMSLVSSSGAIGGRAAHTWTVGPGGYLIVLGALGALVAAGFAASAARQTAELSTDVADDDSLAASRFARRWNAIILSVLIPVALAIPVYTGLGVASAPTLIHGFDLDSWAFWSLAAGALLGVWIGALTRFAQTAAGAVGASAAVLALPLVVPGVVRELPGFTLSTGFWVVLGTVFITLCVAIGAARSAGAIVLRPSWPVGDGRSSVEEARDDQPGDDQVGDDQAGDDQQAGKKQANGPAARVEAKGG